MTTVGVTGTKFGHNRICTVWEAQGIEQKIKNFITESPWGWNDSLVTKDICHIPERFNLFFSITTLCLLIIRLRVVPIFPQGQQREQQASACENHPARERRDAAVREKNDFSFHFSFQILFLSPHRVSPFSRGVIFTRAHVSLPPLSLRKNEDQSQST